MKQFFLIISILIYGFNLSVAQTYTQVTNVKTPNNSTVQDVWSLTSSDISYTTAQQTALANDLAANYNGAQLIEYNSYKYNCHGYAWHVSDGGNKVWIGRYSVTSEDVYWADKSYVPVPESIATKVSYHQDGNHSAIKLDNVWYQSKWGWSWPLVKHYLNDVPLVYEPSKTKKFYMRAPTISGPSDICAASFGSFAVSNAPVGFTWGSSSNLIQTSYGSTWADFSVTGYANTAWVSINLNGVELVRHNLVVVFDAPVVAEITGPENISDYGSYSAVFSSTSPATYCDWATYNSHAQVNGNGYSYIYITYNGTFPESFGLYLIATNACGEDIGFKDIYATGSYYGYSISSYPNPASDILQIEIDRQAIAQAKALQQTTTGAKMLKTDPTYDIRLYDGQGNLLRRQSAKGGSVQFNVANLPNGIYYLHIDDGTGNKPEMRQIVVEH